MSSNRSRTTALITTVLFLLPAVAGATISFARGDIVPSTSRFSPEIGNTTSIIVYDANGTVKN